MKIGCVILLLLLASCMVQKQEQDYIGRDTKIKDLVVTTLPNNALAIGDSWYVNNTDDTYLICVSIGTNEYVCKNVTTTKFADWKRGVQQG